MAGAAAALLLTVTTACSSSSAGEAGQTNGTAPPSPSSTLVKTAADQSVCDDVQKVFLQLATVSARWDPDRDPFDATTATALVPMVSELRNQARSANTEQFRVVVDRNADALGDLAAAIESRHRGRVVAALTETREAYAALPACAHRDGQPTPPRSTATAPADQGSATPEADPSSSGARPALLKDPGCRGARDAYATLGSVTAGWNSEADPFDAQIAQGFRGVATALQSAAKSARHAVVRQELRANGQAFRDLADAMHERDQARVNAGVVAMQRTAVTLAGTCPLT